MKGLLWIVVILGAVWMFTHSLTAPPMRVFSLTSPAFESGAAIPSKYTCDADSIVSPPLTIAGVPEGTKSLVLIMDDPDIPAEIKQKYNIDVFDHWILFNVPPETLEIPEGAPVGEAGLNGSGTAGYTGPCPPPEYQPREHRYTFMLYALDSELQFNAVPTKQEVLDALKLHVLGQAELVGRYARN
jgi:Raf kinase inhibitor-like YbhB/YbcL family protein